MTDLSTATIPEILGELRLRRNKIDSALAQFGGIADVIEQAVISAFDITHAELHSPGRPDRIALPRQAAMTLMRENGMTWEAAASHYGKGHGTASYAVKQILARESSDTWLAETMQTLRTQIATSLQDR